MQSIYFMDSVFGLGILAGCYGLIMLANLCLIGYAQWHKDKNEYTHEVPPPEMGARTEIQMLYDFSMTMISIFGLRSYENTTKAFYRWETTLMGFVGLSLSSPVIITVIYSDIDTIRAHPIQFGFGIGSVGVLIALGALFIWASDRKPGETFAQWRKRQ